MSERLKTIIIDDEPVAIRGLKKLLLKIDSIELLGEFNSGIHGRDFLLKNNIDLMFLDIEMPEMTGIDLLRILSYKPVTIITSAHPQYAIEGYDLDVLDFLVKPIAQERLLKAVNKSLDFIDARKGIERNHDYIFVKCDKIIEKILLSEILYVESLHNYVAICTENKKYISYSSLKNMEGLLPAERFIKVQKSFLVSISKISGFSRDSIIVKDIRIPISRMNKKKILEVIIGNKYLNTT
jgi:DNA-binding LytR/AlgR family response regulator